MVWVVGPEPSVFLSTIEGLGTTEGCCCKFCPDGGIGLDKVREAAAAAAATADEVFPKKGDELLPLVGNEFLGGPARAAP